MKTQQLITIKESDLELVVSEKTLGSLTTNAIQIRDMVKSTLPMYDISNYNDDNIDQAKRDKAALNKAAKLLNSKRLEIEKEFMKPFGEFKEVVAETVKLIGECSAKIDTVVKQNEQQYKDKKLAVIRSYFDDGNTTLIDFRKIFKQEWLNKSTSMKAVQADIETVFAKVDEDLETLKGFGGDDFDVLRTYYMDTMNIGNTIQYANRLKEQRERAQAAEEARIKAEQERKEQEEARIAAEEEQKIQEAAAAALVSKGQSVVDYAYQFLGNPYVWGGTSLTNGADCSGFVQSVYAHFGISLPRTSYEQRTAGDEISYAEAQPGDLILYEGHVGIYMGDGKIINAMNEAQGIGVCSATYTNIVAVRRVL